ncbi:MAG: TetR/AcrR family transcriptional regulator [Chlorobi bacterium]|nr:TetR/AcrR family transcriptional regulator [Chlorobiota bacterium]
MARPPKERQFANLPELIKDAAWRQITQSGASSLSLRGIARDLGITAPAIYNYFPDRDALVTSLIADAYASFGDCQLAARDAFAGQGKELDRLRATGLAYRRWALDHPHRYLLIFGNPVPGYEPPMEELLPVMMRSLGALVGTIAELHALGRLETGRLPLPLIDTDHRFFSLLENADEGMLAVYAISIAVWCRVHGLVSLEITGQLPLFGEDGAALYRFELDAICRQFIRSPEDDTGVIPRTGTVREP